MFHSTLSRRSFPSLPTVCLGAVLTQATLVGCAQKDPSSSAESRQDAGVPNAVELSAADAQAHNGDHQQPSNSSDSAVVSPGDEPGIGLTGNGSHACDGCDAALTVVGDAGEVSGLDSNETAANQGSGGSTDESANGATNESTTGSEPGLTGSDVTASSTLAGTSNTQGGTSTGTQGGTSTATQGGTSSNTQGGTSTGTQSTATSISTSTGSSTIQSQDSSTAGGTSTVQTTTSVATSDTNTTSATGERWAEVAPLFTNQGIAEIQLEVDDAGLASLDADPKTYVAASLSVVLSNGTTIELPDIGLRLKGQLGSFRPLEQKAAFLLKMNEFVSGQKLLGLNKLALNNMVQDPSMIREQLSYLLFREMGVAAPRTGYARVTLNDELFGLYASIEVTDNGPFLDHWFGDNNGSLYEGAYGSDLEDELIETFDLDRGEDVAFADLYDFADGLDTLTDPTTFVADAAAWLNVDSYARFAATELFLAHWDGYAATRNNYFIYRAPDATWEFLPWGTDQTFGDSRYPIFDGDGRVQRLCLASLGCREKLAQAVQDLIELVDELDVQQRIDDLEELITSDAEADPRKEMDNATLHTSIEQIRTFLQVRPETAQSELICTDPSNVDADDDGASGCGDDCDDDNPARNPSADEVCNFVDDDCDGDIDELPECDRCMQTARTSGGNLAFCIDATDYDTARLDCVDRGGSLVSIHSAEDETEVKAVLSQLEISEWWIGFSDLALEGEFAWEDASAVDFVDWNDGEPNDSGGAEDCAYLVSWGGWNDSSCASTRAYICQLP